MQWQGPCKSVQMAQTLNQWRQIATDCTPTCSHSLLLYMDLVHTLNPLTSPPPKSIAA